MCSRVGSGMPGLVSVAISIVARRLTPGLWPPFLFNTRPCMGPCATERGRWQSMRQAWSADSRAYRLPDGIGSNPGVAHLRPAYLMQSWAALHGVWSAACSLSDSRAGQLAGRSMHVRGCAGVYVVRAKTEVSFRACMHAHASTVEQNSHNTRKHCSLRPQ